MIDIQDLDFRYSRKGQPLFSKLRLQLPAGTLCGLLGANGAGKSTLLRLMAGLSFPQQGTCKVLGHEPHLRQPSFLSDVFLLPEEFLLPAVDAATYVVRFGSFYPRFDHALFQKLLTELAVPDQQKLSTLSQGQKKKFLLAFGIATQARLLILDEPTNGLDIPSKSLFRRVLIDHFQTERSFLISTHQVHDLQGLIDSVMVLSHGQILLHETVETLESRLLLSVEQEEPADALYTEKSLEGFKVIRENNGSVETRLDLELMFGMATAAPDKVRGMFRTEARV
jgi:ABC-2 type transport system ATP-binding protein